MSTFRLASVKKPFFMPIKTGHRFDEAEPTVPTETLSAARTADGVSRPAQSSSAAAIMVRYNLITVLLPRASPRVFWPRTSAKPRRHDIAPDSALQFPSR